MQRACVNNIAAAAAAVGKKASPGRVRRPFWAGEAVDKRNPPDDRKNSAARRRRRERGRNCFLMPLAIQPRCLASLMVRRRYLGHPRPPQTIIRWRRYAKCCKRCLASTSPERFWHGRPFANMADSFVRCESIHVTILHQKQICRARASDPTLKGPSLRGVSK